MSITTAWKRFDHQAQLAHLKTIPPRARIVRVTLEGEPAGYALLVTHTPMHKRLPHPMVCALSDGGGMHGAVMPRIGEALRLQRYYTDGLIPLVMLYPIKHHYALRPSGEALVTLARHYSDNDWGRQAGD